MIKNLSETVGYSHNIDTYRYVSINAPILHEAFPDHEFTRAEYDRKLGKECCYSSGELALYHKGLSLDTARKWGFVEVVREEPIHTKMELVYMTPTGKRICSATEYNKMDKEVISMIEGIYGNLTPKLITVPCGNQKRNYYKWNEDNYQKWLEEGRAMINRKVEAKIDSLANSIELLKAMKI